MWRESSRAVGCLGGFTSRHTPIPAEVGGRFLPKVPPPGAFAVNTAVRNLSTQWKLLLSWPLSRFISVFPRLLAGQSSVKTREFQSLPSKRQQTRGSVAETAPSQPLSFVCRRLGLATGPSGRHLCYALH